MTRRKTDPKVTIIGVPTNSSGNLDGVARGPSANNHYAGFGPGTANLFRSDSSIAGPNKYSFCQISQVGALWPVQCCS